MAYQGKYSAQPPQRSRRTQDTQETPRPRRTPAPQSTPEPQQTQRPEGTPARRKKKPAHHPPRWMTLVMLILTFAFPELVLHFSTAQGPSTTFNPGLFLGVLFAVVPTLIVCALVSVFKKPAVNFWIAVGISVVPFLLCASQLVYYKVFGTFYSAYSMANGGQVLQFWLITLKTILANLHLILLMAVPLAVLGIFGRRLCNFRPLKRRLASLANVVYAVILQLLLVLILPIFGTGDMTPYDLYHNNSDSYFSVNSLGLFTAFRLDVTRQLSGKNVGGSIILDGPNTPSPQPSGDSQPADDTTGATETTAPVIDTSPNVLDIDFDALIESTSKDKVKEVHQYFASRTPSNKNEHTGIFEGKNLILITAEAFSSLAVTEERTPTLYKMMHEGYYFSNYYVPDWGTSTTDGEYAFLTGTVPKANTWSFSKSSDNSMPLTMCQQLMDKGYTAYAYHGHTHTYYDRYKYLENLGYTFKAYNYGLDVKKTWPESDVEVVDLSTTDFVNSEPFTAYYMTISGHREFTFTGNYIAYKNKALVVDEPYSTNVQAYLATQLELEMSLQLLEERLKDAGVWENTVIVLTADHYPNGLTVSELSELAGHTIDTSFEIYKNRCIIYTPGMTPEVIEEPCSHLDLLPTLSNLFGLEFDSRLYMGRDVFSDADPLVMFRNRSWITDKARYNSNTKEVESLTGEEVSEDYVKSIQNELTNRFTVSTRILDYDYWSILFD